MVKRRRRSQVRRRIIIVILAPALVLLISAGIILVLNTFFSELLATLEILLENLIHNWLIASSRTSAFVSLLLVDAGVLFALGKSMRIIATVVSLLANGRKRTSRKEARQANSRQASEESRASHSPQRKSVRQRSKVK